jgi:hypothetical protein
MREETQHREDGGRRHEDPLHAPDVPGRRAVGRKRALAEVEATHGKASQEALEDAHGDPGPFRGPNGPGRIERG